MGIKATFERFEKWLGGWPNSALTVMLLAIAAILIVLAFTAKPMEKAIVLSWVLFP